MEHTPASHKVDKELLAPCGVALLALFLFDLSYLSPFLFPKHWLIWPKIWTQKITFKLPAKLPKMPNEN